MAIPFIIAGVAAAAAAAAAAYYASDDESKSEEREKAERVLRKRARKKREEAERKEKQGQNEAKHRQEVQKKQQLLKFSEDKLRDLSRKYGVRMDNSLALLAINNRSACKEKLLSCYKKSSSYISESNNIDKCRKNINKMEKLYKLLEN